MKLFLDRKMEQWVGIYVGERVGTSRISQNMQTQPLTTVHWSCLEASLSHNTLKTSSYFLKVKPRISHQAFSTPDNIYQSKGKYLLPFTSFSSCVINPTMFLDTKSVESRMFEFKNRV